MRMIVCPVHLGSILLRLPTLSTGRHQILTIAFMPVMCESGRSAWNSHSGDAPGSTCGLSHATLHKAHP